MARALKLFSFQRPRRVLMHCVDAGSNGLGLMGRFVCRKCGYDSDWQCECKASEIRRGIPCPRCNTVQQETESK